jgi:hypothetical protein
MDYSELTGLILNEFQSHAGLAFENHLYGCFTLLEQCLDGSGLVVDVSQSFHQIGADHGFFKNPLCTYDASGTYRDAWIKVFAQDISDGFVDQLEDAVFESLGKSQFFSVAVDNGELTEALQLIATQMISVPDLSGSSVIIHNTAILPVKKRLIKSRKGVRIGTPPKTKLRFDKTRKRSLVTKPTRS